MSGFSGRALFWAPRILSIVIIAFLSIFALDVFDGRHSIWQMILAFLIHQIPVFVLIAALILAWLWEWIGVVLYGIAGLLYIVWVINLSRPIPPAIKFLWALTIALPAFVIAGLFLANWLKHDALRNTGR